jgi:hypothetical protein
MMVQFQRAPSPDAIEGDAPRFVAINPAMVAAVFGSIHAGQTVCKLANGSDLMVLGTYDETMAKLYPDGQVADEA